MMRQENLAGVCMNIGGRWEERLGSVEFKEMSEEEAYMYQLFRIRCQRWTQILGHHVVGLVLKVEVSSISWFDKMRESHH